MENKQNTFQYTYSAKQQEEIRRIRKKYLPQEKTEDKMEQLRRLDQRDDSLHNSGRPWLPTAGGGHVLHHALGGKLVHSGRDPRCHRHRCRGRCLSAVYPHYQEGTGKDSPADFKADRRAFQAGVTKQNGRKGLPSPGLFLPLPLSSKGFPKKHTVPIRIQTAVSEAGDGCFSASYCMRS